MYMHCLRKLEQTGAFMFYDINYDSAPRSGARMYCELSYGSRVIFLQFSRNYYRPVIGEVLLELVRFL